MFVPVNCSHCGKPFQVPESALGKLAPCPWCQEAVTALPVSVHVGAAQDAAPAPPQSAPEPLSLDDSPPPEPAPKAVAAKPVIPPLGRKSTPTPAPPVPTPGGRRLLNLMTLTVIGLAVATAVTAVTVGALRRKGGHLVSVDWKMFHAPDGSCSVDLLGNPVEDPDAPAAGERRYTSEGWYSGTKAWVGWKDLTPDQAQMAKGPDSWQLLRPAVLNPERERLKSAFGGYEAEGGGTKSFDPLVIEYRFQTPEGLLVERVIVKADGARPRVYFVGMTGKRLTPDAPELQRLFASFRVND